jgi:lipopolysaccharide transport system ATP-binding protein
MTDVVIRAEGLGKKYFIGHRVQNERYVTLRDTIARNARGVLRSATDIIRGRQLITGDTIEEFWALKDVSFEAQRGEVVGIIGRNGAGKSTLLKILSRITEPTKGRVEIRGRVASLLEVGTGFHPELSGRENIFLNGAILGMSRREIRRKFEEIVAFAEIEKFLDTPVKRYSSGMYVRLAFAVAAHLEPEILLVDEVLAVGDAEFQKKCLGKMQDVAGHGRTVLFVSHNIGSVYALCTSCVYLKMGLVEAFGPAPEILKKYLESAQANAIFKAQSGSSAELRIEYAEVSVIDRASEGIILRLRARLRSRTTIIASFDMRLKDTMGVPIGFASVGELNTSHMIPFTKGVNTLTLDVSAGQLSEGRYLISLDLAIPNIRYIERLEDCLAFNLVRRADIFGNRAPSQGLGFGSMYFPAVLSELLHNDEEKSACE